MTLSRMSSYAAITAFAVSSCAFADTFLWNNNAGGAFETAANWKQVTLALNDGWEITSEAVADHCPGAGDNVFFGSGPYTVTFAEDHTVATIDNLSTTYWSRNGNPADQVVFDLQGHSFEATSRASIFTMYGDYSSFVFTNGTVNCTAAVKRPDGGDQWNLNTTGFGIGLTWGGNWANGEPWSEWIPHLGLTLTDVDANFAGLYSLGALATFRIENGAQVNVDNDVTLERTGGNSLVVSGEGTRLGCRTIALSGHSTTNIITDGAVVEAQAIANGWYGYWSDENKLATFIINNGGKLILTNDSASVNYLEGQADGGEGAVYYDFRETYNHLVWVDGEGSEIRFDTEASWRNPQFEISPRHVSSNNFLRVSNGALVHGALSSSLVIGAGPQSIDSGVIIEDATISVGHFLCGNEWACWDFGEGLMGQSSNAVIRISGPRALLEVRNQWNQGNENNGIAGTMNLNYNAHLDIAIPPDGFLDTTIQVISNRVCVKASQIPGYNTPACHLTLRAKDWSRRHPGLRQVLIESAQDSSEAFQTLIDNAVLPEIDGTAYVGQFTIEDDGTKLVYRCPPSFGTTILVK